MFCLLNISISDLDTCKELCSGNDGYLTLLFNKGILC